MFFLSSYMNPPSASTTSADVDWLFDFILTLSGIFFAIIVVLGTWFVLKYRRRPGHAPQPSPSHSNKLEILWSVIPGVLVGLIFWFGFQIWLNTREVPPRAYEIQVTAQKWNWLFTYPDGTVDKDLHVPVGRPVRLVMTSEDVIHSFFVPDFRLKMDLVPGRYSETWFEVKEPGRHVVYCAEYCGTKHSDMLAQVVAHDQAGFDAWLDDASNFIDREPPVVAGGRIFQLQGCAQCHSLDGSGNAGPSLVGAWGKERLLADGSRVVMDENYARESILDPQAKIRAGFQPVMPTYKGRLEDREITVLLQYLKSLKD